MSASAPTKDQVLERLRTQWPFWAEHCAQIVNTAGKVVPLIPKPAQLRVWEAAKRQMDTGQPVRLLVPKARKEGVSTFAVSHLVQRITQWENHRAISIAQDSKTAGEFLEMATRIYGNLPESPEWPSLKPPIANRSRKAELALGNPARVAQSTGDFGINSSLIADTANEVGAGRGFTFHSVHGSEVAMWGDIERKLVAVLNAVPEDPGTFVILESTSQGFNYWRKLCMAAVNGENDFELVFLPWFEEPQYVRAFLSEQERGEFIDTIGAGPYGEEEPELIEVFGCTPEQLNWRRWKIANAANGDLDFFHQEFPATLDQSFLSTGRTVFSQTFVARMVKQVETCPLPIEGTLTPQSFREYRAMHGTVRVPLEPTWEPGGGPWRVWQLPDPEAQYVIGGDPAGDDSLDKDERAMHAGVVINHRTREQVAEIEMQGDTDEFALQLYLAALFYNRATLAVETTGSWGAPILRRIRKDWMYQFVYKRKRLGVGTDSTSDELGFDTNRTTKGFLIDAGREMLREGTHGIRSRQLARQFTTYVLDGKTKYGPSPGERADLLMAYLIAHLVAHESPIRHGTNGGVVSTTTKAVLNARMGY